MGKCKFRNNWLLNKDQNGFEVSLWGVKHSNAELFCRLCKSIISISTKGFQAVLQHAASTKHIQHCHDAFGPLQLHLTSSASNSYRTTRIQQQCTSTQQNSASLQLYSLTDRHTAAELIWTMKSICSHYSAASCDKLTDTFRAMFPGDVSSQFSLSQKKMHYLLTDALAPYFYNDMLEEARSSFYSVSYDETTNVESAKELQILIRYWSDSKQGIVSRHLKVIFLGSAQGEKLFSEIKTALNDANLPLSNLLMVGCDGPNVNKKVLRLFHEEVLLCRSKGLLEIGTCAIHTVHNAYLKAMNEIGEDASLLLVDVYNYFDGWPARCESYSAIQKNLKLPPRKFVKHSSSRWLTLGTAAERLLEQWEGIIFYFLKSVPGKATVKKMEGAMYKRICVLLQKSTIKAELHVAISTAEIFTKFTGAFQRSEPMIHLLHSELKALLQTLMGRICKEDVVRLLSVSSDGDTLFVSNNLLPLKEIICPYKVREELKYLKDKDSVQFLKSLQNHYISACNFILQKSPFKSKLVKSLCCLHPNHIAEMRSCHDITAIARALPFNTDEAKLLDEWKLLKLEKTSKDYSAMPIDSYWNQLFSISDNFGNPKYPTVAKVIKACLALSHGNADLERCFSISKWALTEDRACMSERTLNAILIVKDELRQYNNCPHLVPITQKLIGMGQNAYKHYNIYLEQRKTAKEQELKRKENEENIKKQLEEKEKELMKQNNTIATLDSDIKEKRKEQDAARKIRHNLFCEATERLRKALHKHDLEEASLAHAMFEGVKTFALEEEAQKKEVDNLQKKSEKRKMQLISTFLPKRSKN